ncbi:MAG: lysylphosphatidylglycerol synthase transmembrane domain-containing protein [Candidatus Marinimicrobia bacterium]|nr:lysylphosphatidylglycerol synthase transmembrane domain-containing protein [Candidatus Neomarinimicrobiota bacterium]
MKKFLSNLLKIGITVFLFWWLFRSVNLKELGLFFRSIPAWMILSIVGLGIINVGGQAFRFLYSVHLLMPPFTLKQGIIAHFSGFTFRLILPGSVGEVGKIFLLPGDNKLRIYTFLLDTFYSTGVMFFFFGISTFLLFPKMWYMLIFCLVFIVFFWIYRLLVKTTNFKQHVPEHVPYFRFGLANITFTTITLVSYIMQYWILLRQWGISLFDQVKACFFILGIGSIPFSFAGMGFRENAAQYVLQPFGIPAEAAVGGALLIFTVNVLIPALIGVILLSFASDIKLKDIKALVKKT